MHFNFMQNHYGNMEKTTHIVEPAHIQLHLATTSVCQTRLITHVRCFHSHKSDFYRLDVIERLDLYEKASLDRSNATPGHFKPYTI